MPNLEQIKQNIKKPTKFIKSTEHSLKITENCLKKIYHLQSENENRLIRVVIDGGGCQGFQYRFQEESSELIGQKNRDIVLTNEKTDLPLIVFDLFSEFYIKDSTLDFEDEILFKGFVIKNNPKVKTSCGCKKSFATDEFFQEQPNNF